MSHKLKAGELKGNRLTDEEIWRILSIVLSTKSNKSSTYKYALIKSLIENLYQVNENFELTYDQLAYSFTKVYWNLIVQHKLTNHNRGKKARIVTIIQEEHRKSLIPPEMVFDKLCDSLQARVVNKVKLIMKINVFGALYGDTRGNFYAFNHKIEKLRINPYVHRFMLIYQRLIVQLTNYQMAAMIEDLNKVPQTNFLLRKVEAIAKRSSLVPFEKILLSHFDSKCFYCGKVLTGNKRETHVDHFVPWSFVQSDQIWNLVLSCNKCNSAKSDKLPERDYLDSLIYRNDKLKALDCENQIIRSMENYQPKKIVMLYDYSVRNGFDEIWTP
jgi:HNH endonuclease